MLLLCPEVTLCSWHPGGLIMGDIQGFLGCLRRCCRVWCQFSKARSFPGPQGRSICGSRLCSLSTCCFLAAQIMLSSCSRGGSAGEATFPALPTISEQKGLNPEAPGSSPALLNEFKPDIYLLLPEFLHLGSRAVNPISPEHVGTGNCVFHTSIPWEADPPWLGAGVMSCSELSTG